VTSGVPRVENLEMLSWLTPRQQREREFFDEYWSRYQPPEVDFDVVQGNERRPWNSYWYVFEAAKQCYQSGARKLLDFGCGGGAHAVTLAAMGYEVSGFDISPRSIETARQVAAAHGLADRIQLSVQTSERLDYPDNYFDVVVGIDILHHVEIAPSVAECIRVLRPGGVAFFREFIEVPAFDRVRNTALVRFFFPNTKTLDLWHHITDDERKLNAQDIAAMRALCPALMETRFHVFARLDRLLRRHGGRGASRMEMLDYWLCKKLPALNRLGGSVVLQLTKDVGPTSDAGVSNSRLDPALPLQ